MKILSCDDKMRSFMEQLPQSFAEGKGEILYDKRNQVRKFSMNVEGLPEVIIVKRFKKPNITQCLSYSIFGHNKAEKAYCYAERLLAMGIDTPKPLGALTQRNAFGLVRQYYFASTANNDPSCWKVLDPTFEDKESLIEALAKYLVTLHEKGFLHGDTNLSNFLWHRESDGSYHFAVIDVNRSKFLGRPATRKEALSNLFRLTHSQKTLELIVRQYAIARNWEEDQAVQEVRDALHRFEKKKIFLSHFKKNKFKIEQTE